MIEPLASITASEVRFSDAISSRPLNCLHVSACCSKEGFFELTEMDRCTADIHLRQACRLRGPLAGGWCRDQSSMAVVSCNAERNTRGAALTKSWGKGIEDMARAGRKVLLLAVRDEEDERIRAGVVVLTASFRKAAKSMQRVAVGDTRPRAIVGNFQRFRALLQLQR